MSGYALLSPTLAGGPPGWAAWAIGGTILTVGAYFLGKEVIDNVQKHSEATSSAVPRECIECKRGRYSVRIHAQGSDIGGTSSSTIGAPALNQTVPITVAQGLTLSNTTWGMLGRRQRLVRADAKVRADNYIRTGPPGGRFGLRTFPAADLRGGKRYDVDIFGDGPSFIS